MFARKNVPGTACQLGNGFHGPLCTKIRHDKSTSRLIDEETNWEDDSVPASQAVDLEEEEASDDLEAKAEMSAEGQANPAGKVCFRSLAKAQAGARAIADKHKHKHIDQAHADQAAQIAELERLVLHADKMVDEHHEESRHRRNTLEKFALDTEDMGETDDGQPEELGTDEDTLAELQSKKESSRHKPTLLQLRETHQKEKRASAIQGVVNLKANLRAKERQDLEHARIDQAHAEQAAELLELERQVAIAAKLEDEQKEGSKSRGKTLMQLRTHFDRNLIHRAMEAKAANDKWKAATLSDAETLSDIEKSQISFAHAKHAAELTDLEGKLIDANKLLEEQQKDAVASRAELVAAQQRAENWQKKREKGAAKLLESQVHIPACLATFPDRHNIHVPAQPLPRRHDCPQTQPACGLRHMQSRTHVHAHACKHKNAPTRAHLWAA